MKKMPFKQIHHKAKKKKNEAVWPRESLHIYTVYTGLPIHCNLNHVYTHYTIKWNWLSEVKKYSYKYVVIANKWHIMLWHGNCRNKKKSLKLPYCQCQPCSRHSYGQHAIRSWSKSKKIPLNKKRKKSLCTVPYIFAFFLKKEKTKTSPVHHKLSTTWQAGLAAWWGENSETEHAFTTGTVLVYFVIQTGIQKSNLNKTRLTGI